MAPRTKPKEETKPIFDVPCASRDAFWRWVAFEDTTSFRREVSLETVMPAPVFRDRPGRASDAAILDIRSSSLTYRALAAKWRVSTRTVRNIKFGLDRASA